MHKLSWLAVLLAALNGASAALTAPGTNNPTGETTSQITWNWTDTNTAEDGYRVYDAPAGGTLLATLGVNSTSWTETGVTAGTRYTRFVCAYAGATESSRIQLPSAMASYPVTWHPTNSVQSWAIADTYIYSGYYGSDPRFEDSFRCGYRDASVLVRRGMVQFDESALPAATLRRAGTGRARLTMYVTGVGSATAYNISGYRVTAPWDETNNLPTWAVFSTAKESSVFTVASVGDMSASYTWPWDPYAAGMPTNHQGLMFLAVDETDNRFAKAFASKDNTNGWPAAMMSMDYYLPANPGWVTNLLVLAGVGDGKLDTVSYATPAGLAGDTDLYGSSKTTYGGKAWVAAVGSVTDVVGFSDHYGWNLNGTGSPFNMGQNVCALFNLYVNSSTAASGCYLRCGADDGVRVIVNGTVVGTDDSTRTWDMEQSVFGPFNLNAGWNRVLIKVRNGTANSGLKAVRFSNADATVWSGSTLSFAADDTTAPVNPSSCTESGGASNGVWQNRVSAPSFTWAGAADVAGVNEGASGLRGYRVYFGPSASGTPNALQTTTAYAPGAQPEGTSYLRISTVDKALNAAAPVTLFTLQYDHTPPTGVSLGVSAVTSGSITVTGAGTDAVSGIDAATGYTYRLGSAGDSGSQGGSYTWTGLAANTLYTNLFVIVSDRASNTTASAVLDQWTLSAPPDAGSVVADTASPCAGSPVTWSAVGGFGSGTVQYYRYAWDQSATHTWTDTEAQWSGGALVVSPSSSGNWFLHLKGYNGGNVGNGSYDYALPVAALPVPQNKSLSTWKNQPAMITVSNLLAGATGAANVSWVATTTPGAAVTLANGIVTYTPPTDFTGTDSFSFSLASSAGCAALGTVTVTVNASHGESPNAVYAGLEGNAFVARFTGTPGESYTIEAADSPSGPWNKLGANITVPTADQGWGIGVFEVRDSMTNGLGFYRAVWPAY